MIGMALAVSCAEDKVEVNTDKKDIEAPQPVRDLTVVAYAERVDLIWENPDTKDEDDDDSVILERNEDFDGVMILRRIDDQPLDLPIRNVEYHVGEMLGDSLVVYVGDAESFQDGEVTAGEIYNYGLISFDEVPNYGEPAFVEATPGSSSKARFSHTVTALDDGRVLIVGGIGYGGPQDTVEVFDPQTGQFQLLEARLRVSRFGHNAVMLADGRVFISGGYGKSAQNSLRTATIFNPDTDRFEFIEAAMTYARALHTATLLTSGKVLILGGANGERVLDSAEVFNPEDGTFALMEAKLKTPRSSHTATLFLNEGNPLVLVAGGYDGEGATAGIQLFDQNQAVFTDLDGKVDKESLLAESRLSHTADWISDDPADGLLLCGGFTGNSLTGEPTATCELFDPQALTVEAGPELLEARTGHASVRIADGRLLILGGIDADLNVLASAELYDPAEGIWSATGSLIRGRTIPRAVLLNDERVLVVGGNASGNLLIPQPISTAEIFSADSLSFSIQGAP